MNAEDRERAEDLDRLFALQQTRMGKATALWREATGKRDVMPDLGDLLDWLQARIEILEDCVRTAYDALRRVSRLIQGPSWELQDSIMVDALAAMRQCDALLTLTPGVEPSGEEAKEEK